MTIPEPYFWEFLIFSDDGEIIGIEKDAPRKAKKEFKEYIKMHKKARSKNMCGSLDFDVLAEIASSI